MNPITFNEIEYFPIADFDKYYISKCGNILSFKGSNPKILSSGLNKSTGYIAYYLCRNNKRETKTLHRLLAMTFLPNFSPKLQVDHKDNNKLNNDLSNLHMVTASDNQRNKLRYSGVYLGYDKRYETFEYRAQWCDDNGEKQSKTFSCKKYGFGGALRLAQAKRDEMVDLYYNRPIL